MKALLANVIKQASIMESVRNEMHALELRIEDISARYDEVFGQMLSPDSIAVDAIDSTGRDLAETVADLQADVSTFVGTLATRVPLIASAGGKPSPSADIVDGSITTRFPFDPLSVDRMVRSDANQYSMRLGGQHESCLSQEGFVWFLQIGEGGGYAVGGRSITDEGPGSNTRNKAAALRQLKIDRTDDENQHMINIQNLKTDFENVSKLKVSVIDRCISSLRRVITKMRSYSDIQDDIALLNMLTGRASSLDELDLQNHRLQTRVNGFFGELNAAEQEEVFRRAEGERARQLEEKSCSSRSTNCVQLKRRRGRIKSLQNTVLCDLKMVGHQSLFLILYVRLMVTLGTDVFSFGGRSSMDRDSADLISRIRSLRKRLNSIGFNSAVRPGSTSRGLGSTIPTLDRADAMESDFTELEDEVKRLPDSVDSSALAELLSLKEEMRASRMLLSRVKQLAQFSSAVVLCDNSFSDFLDHIDNFSPTASSSSSKSVSKRHTSSLLASAEDELSERLAYAKGIMGDMNEHFEPVADELKSRV